MSEIDVYDGLKAQTADIKERFATESVDGTMTVCKDEGLYRHLEFNLPKSTAYWFEIVTWPCAATPAATSSPSTRRTTSCRSSAGRTIDPVYWGQKVFLGGEKATKVYAEDRVRRYIRQAAERAEGQYPGLLQEVEDELFSMYSGADLETEAGAKVALAASSSTASPSTSATGNGRSTTTGSCAPATRWPGLSPSATPRWCPPADPHHGVSPPRRCHRRRGRVRPKRPGRRGGGPEAVPAQAVEVLVLERGQPRDVLVLDVVALGTQLGDGGVDVARRPEHHGVEDQAEGGELVPAAFP